MAIVNTNTAPILQEGTNITLTQTGQTITITATDTTNAPGGSNTQVQFNDSGVFGGDAGLTYNKTTNVVSLESVDFATTPVAADAERRLKWDNDEGSLVLTLKGGNVTIPIGAEVVSLVYNAEATTLAKGEVVYVFGAQGQRISVKRAVNTSDATSAQTLGVIAESIAAGAEGFCMVQGMIRGIDTSAYVQGDTLYLSATAGQYTKTKPVAPNHLVYIGFVVKVNASSGEIFIRPQNGYEMDEIHDYLEGSVQNNDVISYESSSGLYKPKSIPTLLGYTPANQATTITINGTSYDLSANRTWSVGTVTSVAALTLGTTGTDVSSSVANGTTTPVITLNIPTASATNRGALSSTDWTTFNNKLSAAITSLNGLTASTQTFTNDTNVTITSATSTHTLGWSGQLSIARGGTGLSSLGTANQILRVNSGATALEYFTFTGATASGASGQVAYFNGTSSITGESNLFWDATNDRLGIGTASPTNKLNISNNGNSVIAFRIDDTNANASYLSLNASNTDAAIIVNGTSAIPLDFYIAGSVKMRLDTSGNLGLGVTPSAWGSPFKALEGGDGDNQGYFAFQTNVNAIKTGVNHYFDGSNYVYKFSSSPASRYDINTDNFIWNLAISGTAGQPISFTQAMTLNSDGNLLLGLTTIPSAVANYRTLVLGGTDGSILDLGQTGTSYGRVSANASGLNLQALQSGDEIQFRLVNTQAMTLNASGNLGLGVTPSAWGAGQTAMQVGSRTALVNASGGQTLLGNNYYSNGTNNIYLQTASATLYEQFGGSHIFYNAPSGTATQPITFTQAMTLDSSGRLGIGTPTPDTKLQVAATGSSGISVRANTSGDSYYRLYQDSNITSHWYSDRTNSKITFGSVTNVPLTFETNNTERMHITSGGNIGVAVTPSAWLNTLNALQIGAAHFFGQTTGTGTVSLGNNAYLNSTPTYIYQYNGKATRYSQYDGGHEWYTAGTGTAGNPITFTQAMTLDSSGRLGIGVSPSYKLDVNGTLGVSGAATFSSSVTAAGATFSGTTAVASAGATSQVRIDRSGAVARIQNYDNGSAANISLAWDGGNIGIGTTSPTAKLVVEDGVANQTGAPTYRGSMIISNGGGSTSSAGGLEFHSNSGGSGYGWRVSTPDLGSQNIPMSIQTRKNTASWSEIIRVTNTGEIGINCVPNTQLQVNGTPSTDWGTLTLFDSRTAAVNQGGEVVFSGYDTTTSSSASFGKIVGRKENSVSGNKAGYVSIYTYNATNWKESVRISSSGFFGINNTSPTARLVVDGLVNSESGKATYRGDIVLGSGGGSTTTDGGFEFVSANSGSGYGWRIGAPDLGSGNIPMIFQSRSNTASWTERIRMTVGGLIGLGDNFTSYDPPCRLSVNGPGSDVEAMRVGNSTGGSGGTTGKTYIGLAPWSSNGVNRTYAHVLIGTEEETVGSYNAFFAIKTRNSSSDVNPTERFRITAAGDTRPGADNTYDCGVAAYRWNDIYATNGTIQTSDLREKTDIQTSDLGLDFVNKLKPVSYRWKTGVRTHYGFTAQDVKEILGDKDFAGFIHNQEADKMGLRYTEFIAVLVKAIQEQQEQINQLKNGI